MIQKVKFSDAVTGFILADRARHLSEHTIADYQNTFKKFSAFLEGDPLIQDISCKRVEEFLRKQKVSNKTLSNYHVGLSALWAWAKTEHMVKENILTKVSRPKPMIKAIVELTEADIKALLAAMEQSKRYIRPGKRECSHILVNCERNKAILLLLLDTGIRVQELCDLRIYDIDMKNTRIIVKGKGAKERMLPFSPRTGQVIWKYLLTRKDSQIDEPLFATSTGRFMDRGEVSDMLNATGIRAGVKDVHPHRLRHTFAITYLRNGGDAYTLQAMLGHSTLDMVKRYLHIAQMDLNRVHRRASPVDQWRL